MTHTTPKSSVDDRAVINAHTEALSPLAFEPYQNELTSLLRDFRKNPSEHGARITAALDGQPGRELRQRYKLDLLRATGTFFTGSELASRMTQHMRFPQGAAMPLIIDPACGAGDLLVATAKNLPVFGTVAQTLRAWGQQLAGFDVNSSFIETTKVRLAMLAVQRVGGCPETGALDLETLFPQIKVSDGAAKWNLTRPVSTIVVNPPFAHVMAGKECEWSQGRTSHAAIFIERCLEEAGAGGHIAAILPDVLRTGTRYAAWRNRVERSSKRLQIEVVGQFDQFTDVDVFILKIDIGESAGKHGWGIPESKGGLTLSDLFNIHVGPVVPFRLTKKGNWRRYAHSDVLPPWKTVNKFSESIRFTGKTYKGPLVLVRRTSKSNYKQRCIATIVTSPEELAIENHLLILQPKDGSLKTCSKLLDLLQSVETTDWMNQRIRCRHLTVGSIGDLPWEGGH